MLKFMLMTSCLLLCAAPLWAAPFVDHSNGTVTDQATGLVWQQTDDGTTKTWQGALDYCNTLTLASSSDWRLPNIKELRSIVDESRFSPAIDPVFSGINTSYWSSSSNAYDPDNAWFVYFVSGLVNFYDKTSSSYYVRCVR